MPPSTNENTLTHTTPAVTAELDLIETALESYLNRQSSRAHSHDERFRSLWQRIAHLARGGKRVRPRMLLAAHAHLGGTRTEDAVRAGLAVELLHTALLVHDDIIDGDTERRGSPTIAASFSADATGHGIPSERAHTWGNTMALLAGDLLLSSAVRTVGELEAPRRIRERIIELLDESIFAAASGEQADVAYGIGLHTPNTDDIRTMMHRKTATYSFDVPLRAGAVLADADDHLVTQLGAIGRSLGVLFQLRDDLLGVFGTASETGKSTLSDLREGKVTLLIGHATGSPAWHAVEELWGSAELDEAGAATLRHALIRSGARARLDTDIAEQASDTLALIRQAALPAPFTHELERTVLDGTGRIR